MKNAHAKSQIMLKITATMQSFSPAGPCANEHVTER
jgi:hypothetical protein